MTVHNERRHIAPLVAMLLSGYLAPPTVSLLWSNIPEEP